MCTQWMDKRYGSLQNSNFEFPPKHLLFSNIVTFLHYSECSMGGSCKFAHGNQELRVPERVSAPELRYPENGIVDR